MVMEVEDGFIAEPAAREPRSGPVSEGLSWWVGLLSLTVLCLIVYVPGFFTLPVVDRDEARFAQASRQMLTSGDWVIPRVQDRPRLNKPPMIYWAQAGSAWVFTGGQPLFDAIWMYRVPSLLSGVVAVLFTWRLGLAMFDSRTARLGAALLAVCPVVVWETHQARSDMLLLAFTTVAMLALWQVRVLALSTGERRSTWRWALLFWVALAGGILTKGPITPIIALFTIAASSFLTRRWRWVWKLQPIIGILIVAGLVAPWVIAVGTRIGWNEYLQIIWNETLGRSADAKEGHWGPPGYHTLLLAMLFWPGSMLTGVGVFYAIGSVRRSRSGSGALSSGEGAGAEAFCLAWVLPAWLMFELVATKLPHYTLPLFPPLALLSARAVLGADAGFLAVAQDRLARLGMAVWLILGVVWCVGLPVVVIYLARSDLGWLQIVFGLMLVAIAANYIRMAAATFNRTDRHARAQMSAIVAMILGVVVLIGLVLPRWQSMWVTPQIVHAMNRVDPSRSRPLAAVEYHEDSLIYEARGGIDRISVAGIEDWLTAHPTGLLILPEAEANDRPWLRALDVATGFNYSKGRRVRLVVAERAP